MGQELGNLSGIVFMLVLLEAERYLIETIWAMLPVRNRSQVTGMMITKIKGEADSPLFCPKPDSLNRSHAAIS